jgi:bifunctional ADP-heptose synthase (sugar kinase/adenylyltransferase)
MAVNMVVVFEESTPLELIKIIRPDVLIKGGDWAPEAIVGADFVMSIGGEVMSLPLVKGISTTGIMERICQANS